MRTRLIRGALLLLPGIVALGIRAMAASDAGKTPVVLELFTSEGCSSCPPADRLLQSLDEKQPFSGADLIVLSEHVDYWNGSDWIDPYSSKLFSARQRSYAEHFRLDSVYTPQAVIDGQQEAVGSNAVEIRNAVEAATRNPKVAVTVSNAVRDGNRIKFHLMSAGMPSSAGPFTVYVALAENKVQSNVARGENGGRALTHTAVVRTLARIEVVKGGVALSKDVTVPISSGATPSGFRVVVLLQDDRSHKIVGAAYEKIQG